MGKDVDALEHAYRSAIVHLEESRIRLTRTRAKAQIMYELLEKDRVTCIKESLTTLSEAFKFSNVRAGMQLEVFERSVERVRVEEDVKIAKDCFFLHWPENEPIYFQSFKNKLPAKGTRGLSIHEQIWFLEYH
jgi:hypothetical protein